ncbi:hypothetical protein [Metabacillus rhizolycopersici]|uniref:Uncharacterized protein n=1 Tax=Metabacillus rhizolycopersici TaxID=2875709 RepID=A0ABS7USQ8_9BACI|nr:hypothetical protein [Metabacillus rhizolycopersici]MBZ5751343.1 hypothetical protein [Metabacillus rhizolycopersici]
MKRSTKRIIEIFPNFKGKLMAYKNVLLAEEAMKGLNEVEATFLKLAWFFEEPEHENFNIGLLYQHLDNNWLELALELIVQFFREETYLIQDPVLSLIRKGSNEYFNQKQFADYLSENGLNYDKRKLNVYYSRGKVPKADIILAGTSYWSRSTVEDFCEREKNRLKKD